MIGYFRAFGRFVLFILITSYYVVVVVFRKLLGICSMQRTFSYVQSWSKVMNAVLGIRIEQEVVGNPRGALIVMNHRSYIDGVVIMSLVKGVTVVKAEVAMWPVIGTAMKLGHTIFVDRENKESRNKTRESIKWFLDQNHSIIIFPEGTSYKAPQMGGFKLGPFQIAAEGNFPIVPVAIEYKDYNNAWVGDDTFLPHFLKTFRKKNTYVRLSFGPEIKPDNSLQAMNQAHGWINVKTTAMRESW